jgi:hypothetical protein
MKQMELKSNFKQFRIYVSLVVLCIKLYSIVFFIFLLFLPGRVFAMEGARSESKVQAVALSSIIDGWTRIEAESCDTLGPVAIKNEGGVLNYTADNPWVQYNNVDFHTETKYIQMHVANGGEKARIQLLLDNTTIDTLTFENTGDWNTFNNLTFKLSIPQSGIKKIKFIFLNGSLNIDWFLFLYEFPKKLRVVISSDFPPTDVVMSGGAADHTSDPDDVQSMVRFLLYANEFDIEGMVASSGTFANIAKKQNIMDMINLYDQVDENLRKHDSLFPSPEYLRSVTFQGRSGTWGGTVSNNIGAGKDSQASDSIIRIIDKPDSRPVWFCFWGDCSNLAQAIWKVKSTRSVAQLQTFLSKIRIFQIAHQDSTIDWMLTNFPDLFIIYSNTSFTGIFGGSGDPLGNITWLNTNIRQNHGPLGAVYPPAAMGVDGLKEGDSPSFLYLVSAAHGMNNPEDPSQESWGGQYVRSGITNHWIDGIGGSTISKWKSQYQAEFAQRADWMVYQPDPTQVRITQNITINNSIIIYPNPLKNELNVKSENEFDTLRIIDMGGKAVFVKSFNEKTKSTTLQLNLIKGLYILKLSDNKSSVYSKMIVE